MQGATLSPMLFAMSVLADCFLRTNHWPQLAYEGEMS